MLLMLALGVAVVSYVPKSLDVSRIESNVVMLTNESSTGGGTGFEVVTPHGQVLTLTNRHICDHDARYAHLEDGRIIPLRILEISKTTDLCILEGIQGYSGLTVATEELQHGDIVDIYGYGMLLPLTHSAGEFVGEMGTPVLSVLAPQYVTNVILPGNSGSPVLKDGKVVGVAYASGEQIAFRALIVPLSDVKDFLRPY